MQGYHSGGLPIATVGLLKGMAGLVLRPTAGMLEWVGKGTHGMGLICLGREAITGSAQRRMRAPGALSDEPPDVSLELHVFGCQAGMHIKPSLLSHLPGEPAAWAEKPSPAAHSAGREHSGPCATSRLT